MPIYEYEPDDFECLICSGRFEVLQAINDEPLQYCPTCGLEVRRLISRASISISRKVDLDKAGKQGFTTWKRTKKATWEKLSGPGVDAIVGTDADIASVEAEKKSKKRIDLDKPE